jgi:hypothetical protein
LQISLDFAPFAPAPPKQRWRIATLLARDTGSRDAEFHMIDGGSQTRTPAETFRWQSGGRSRFEAPPHRL